MSEFVGADPAELRGFGRTVAQCGTRIVTARDQIQQHLGRGAWTGSDAGRFRARWSSVHAPALSRVAAQLEAISTSVHGHADEQERASESGGSAGGGLPAGGGPTALLPMDFTWPWLKEDHTPLTQQQADEIYQKYQVTDDPDADPKQPKKPYEPTWLQRTAADLAGKEFPSIPVLPGEQRLLEGLSPWELKTLSDVHDLAFDEADRRYPGTDQNDDHNDAFRHAYWNALMARDIDYHFAEDYATAHERIPGNDPAREAMDLYNNEVGRRIAREHPYATREELADYVAAAVKNGEMVVIGPDGNLVPSNSITPEQTGEPDPNAAPVDGMDPTGSGKHSPGGR